MLKISWTDCYHLTAHRPLLHSTLVCVTTDHSNRHYRLLSRFPISGYDFLSASLALDNNSFKWRFSKCQRFVVFTWKRRFLTSSASEPLAYMIKGSSKTEIFKQHWPKWRSFRFFMYVWTLERSEMITVFKKNGIQTCLENTGKYRFRSVIFKSLKS